MTKMMMKARKATADASSWRKHMRDVADTLKVSPSSATPDFSDIIKNSSLERLNERELHSIYALLAYVAYNQNIRQETVQMIVEAHFGIDHVAKLPRGDYMRAVEYLVDLKMDEILN